MCSETIKLLKKGDFKEDKGREGGKQVSFLGEKQEKMSR